MTGPRRGSVLVVGGTGTARERRVRSLAETAPVSEAADADTALENLDDAEVLVVDADVGDYAAAEFVALARERDHPFRAVLVAPASTVDDPIEAGFDTHLYPPVDPDALVAAVETAFACRAYDRAIEDLYETAADRAEAGEVSRERIAALRAEADAALAAVDAASSAALIANSPFGADEEG